MLLAIAVLPALAPRFWESNLRKLAVSLCLGIPVFVLYLGRSPLALAHTAEDYVSFMVLLGSLFVIAGGVRLEGDLTATPRANSAFLAAGAVLASVVGTTGASMLLIRPLLQANANRTRVAHTVVFFIFLVSNVGGSLTPIGDPPLFLGYLQGVPFTWTFRLLPHWLLTCGVLLALYYVLDTRALRQDVGRGVGLSTHGGRPLRAVGIENLVLLGGVVLAAAVLPAPWREGVMVGLGLLSWRRTLDAVRKANHFSLHPILEVAAVFSGIFLTMMPALDILRAHGASLGVRAPWQFFWATGLLSSVLDNAPTYLAFLALGQGLHLSPEVAGVPHHVLEAISAGAVFMGANSYIGNGPNFMVRSIAEARGVKMPGFFGYMLYSGAVLIPVFILVTVVFFRC